MFANRAFTKPVLQSFSKLDTFLGTHRYYRAISTQPADVQLEMLEELLAKVVLDERSAYNHQLMHILADPAREWPKFYQPWSARRHGACLLGSYCG